MMAITLSAGMRETHWCSRKSNHLRFPLSVWVLASSQWQFLRRSVVAAPRFLLLPAPSQIVSCVQMRSFHHLPSLSVRLTLPHRKFAPLLLWISSPWPLIPQSVFMPIDATTRENDNGRGSIGNGNCLCGLWWINLPSYASDCHIVASISVHMTIPFNKI